MLRKAWQGLNQAFRNRIESLGITPNQFSILRWLEEGDPLGLSQRTLVSLMMSDPNTISATLARMEKSGLVSRGSHERDRRVSRVRLLPAGCATLEKARPIALAHQATILDALPPRRRELFLVDLELVASICSSLADLRSKHADSRAASQRCFPLAAAQSSAL